MFASLRLLFVFLVLGVPAALVGIPWSALRGNFRTMYRWGMGSIRLGVKAAGIRVRVEGLENVPVGVSCIFMSNHVSNLDPPVLLPSIPGMTSVFLKKSLMKIPLLGTAMRMGKFVPVDRGNQRESAKASVAAAAEALKSGLHMLIFAEGTRSKDGRLAAFKRGPFYLAKETEAPVIPVAMGTNTALSFPPVLRSTKTPCCGLGATTGPLLAATVATWPLASAGCGVYKVSAWMGMVSTLGLRAVVILAVAESPGRSSSLSWPGA